MTVKNWSFERSRAALAAALSMLLFVAVQSAPAARAQAIEAMTVRFGHSGTEESLNGTEARAFADAVNKLSGGKITVQLFPNEQLGGEQQMLDQTRSGALDMSMTNSDKFASFVPEFDAISQPFLIRDMAAADKVASGEVGQVLLDSIKSANVKGLSLTFHADRTIVSRKPFHNPAEANGLRLREQASPTFLPFWQSVGVTAVGISAPETYTALSQGTVDAATSATWYLRSSKWYEVCKYFINFSPFFSSHVMYVNLALFESWPKQVQDIFVEAAQEASMKMREKRDHDNKAAVDAFRQAGLQIIDTDQIDMDAFKKIVADNHLWDKAAGQDLIKTIRDSGLSN